jgi:hypothetical protein
MRTLLVLSLALAGCGGFDPVGTYEGTATRTSQTMRMLADLAPDGTSTVSDNNANNNETGVVARITRIDETHLNVALGEFCRVRIEQSPEPNEHNATIELTPLQQCHLVLDGFEGDVPVSGHAQFDRDQENTPFTLSITGSAQRGDPNRAGYLSVTFSYQFRGERRPQ